MIYLVVTNWIIHILYIYNSGPNSTGEAGSEILFLILVYLGQKVV